jgi:hypothetical protein
MLEVPLREIEGLSFWISFEMEFLSNNICYIW